MDAKILIVDDEPDIRELMSFHLKKAGYRVVLAASGEEALRLLERERPDLVVLDIMLPGYDGLELLKQLRYGRLQRPTPVIMLTAKGEELDRVLGFELGADDYVTKPFSIRELMLRIKAVLARGLRAGEEPQEKVEYAGIVLDRSRHQAQVRGRPVALTATEFKLLACFLDNPGRVLTRDRLLEKVWGYNYAGTTRTVDTHVQRLRDKLGSEAGHCIRTVRGVGYRLESPAEQL